MKNIDEHLH